MNEIQLCYFAALICGLRLINEKEKELGKKFGETELDAGALIHFVRVKGDQLVNLHFGNRPISDMKELPEIPIPAKFKKICSEDCCDRPAASKGLCSAHYSRKYSRNHVTGPIRIPGWKQYRLEILQKQLAAKSEKQAA